MHANNAVAKKFINIEKLLYLVHATDHTQRKAWYYVMVHPQKLPEFRQKLLAGELVLSEYGEIVASGYGETISPALREQLEERLKKKLEG